MEHLIRGFCHKNNNIIRCNLELAQTDQTKKKIGFNMKILILLLLLLPNLSNAKTAEWLEVINEDDLKMFVDISSYKFENNLIKFWIKTKYFKKEKSYSGYEYDSALSLNKYNCSENTKLISTVTTYNGDAVVETQRYDNPKFKYIIPDSVADHIKNTVCQFDKK